MVSILAGKIRSYQDLQIWQRSVQLVETIYRITNEFPKEELYGLTSQIRRAVTSIPSNIAEGFARKRNKEFRQFLYVSLGSCAEVSTQTIIASKLSYIDDTKADVLLKEIEEISKMTMSLIKKLN